MKNFTLTVILLIIISFQSNSQMKADNYSLIDDNNATTILLLGDVGELDLQSNNFDGNDDLKKRRKKRRKKKSRRGKKSSSSELNIGFKAGVNLATISGDGTDDASSIIGIAAGAFGQYQLNDMLAVVAEANFEQKGYKDEYSESMTVLGQTFSSEYKSTMNFNYITIPIMARAIFGESIKFYANAGPYIGLFMGGKFETESIFNGETTSASGDIDDGVNTIDIGAIAGGGVLIPVSDAFSLMLDVRYSMGFTSWADGGGTVKHNAIGVNFGAVIPL